MISCLLICGLLSGVSAAAPRGDFLEWRAELDGTHVVPPTEAAGSAVVEIIDDMDWTPSQERWTSWIAYQGLSGPVTGAYLRWGHDDENGPIAFTLRSGYFPNGDETVLDFPLELYGYLDSDSLYVVVSTALHPDGEVRARFVNVTPPAVEESSWGSVRWVFR